MTERVLIYDLSGSLVYDPEETNDFVTGLNWESSWPKGYGVCSFQIRRRDLFEDWAIKESYGVKVFDGADIVYQGRIETLSRSMSGTDEYVQVQCLGWFVILEERLVHKYWIDNKASIRLRWPDDLEQDMTQNRFNSFKRDNVVTVKFGSYDTDYLSGETYRELYELPSGYVWKIQFKIVLRSGENFIFRVMNMDNASYTSRIRDNTSQYYDITAGQEHAVTAQDWVQKYTRTVTFTEGDTTQFELWWCSNKTDEYDQNDVGAVSNLIMWAQYESGHSAGTPAYTQGELVEDILLMAAQKGQQLSTDMDNIGEPGYTLNPFTVEEPTPAMRVIEDIAQYGDSDLNAWGLAVWDSTGTSDGLPRVVFEARSTADYEYTLELSEQQLAGLTYEKISSELYNNVIVQYTNQRDELRYRDSDDNANLADSSSIASEYQRDYLLKAGLTTSARADRLGRRFLSYHKDRLTSATFSVRGYITTKSGNKKPANQVKAGQRIKLLNTGEVFFIRHTRYDAESQTVSISPDMDQDQLAMRAAQVRAGLRAG